jgi:NAD(P)H-flavin reductase
VLSREPESSDWSGARGLVTDGLQTRLPDLHTREAYVCGPPAMVDAATDALRACGVSAAAIRSDSFVVNGL